MLLYPTPSGRRSNDTISLHIINAPSLESFKQPLKRCDLSRHHQCSFTQLFQEAAPTIRSLSTPSMLLHSSLSSSHSNDAIPLHVINAPASNSFRQPLKRHDLSLHHQCSFSQLFQAAAQTTRSLSTPSMLLHSTPSRGRSNNAISFHVINAPSFNSCKQPPKRHDLSPHHQCSFTHLIQEAAQTTRSLSTSSMLLHSTL